MRRSLIHLNLFALSATKRVVRHVKIAVEQVQSQFRVLQYEMSHIQEKLTQLDTLRLQFEQTHEESVGVISRIYIAEVNNDLNSDWVLREQSLPYTIKNIRHSLLLGKVNRILSISLPYGYF